MLPALLFAYANNNGQPLPELIYEKDAIAHALDSLRIDSKLLYEDGIRTTDQLTNSLINNQRVCIFHFAGHANSHQLLFEDHTAEIKGVIPLLKLQKQLFLVVLNGCSTAEQVERLIEVGVPAVIATKSTINDLRAREFGEILYKVLASGRSLIEAFEAAVAPRRQLEQGLQLDQTDRGMLLTKNNQPDEQGWILRYLPEKEKSVHTWTLPQGEDHQDHQEDEEEKQLLIEVNESLIETLREIVGKYQPGKLNGDTGSRSIQKNLYEALPYPIGVQIRQLLATDERIGQDAYSLIGKTRLMKLINSFDIITELLLYVLMAQLWKGMYEKGPTFVVTSSCRKILHDYFNNSSEEFRKSDVLPIARAIREVLQYNNVAIFIDEIHYLKNLLDADLEFKEAYGFMQLMKQAKFDNTLKADYREEAERQFIILLRQLGFIARYNLLNIRQISVIKRRYFLFEYNHRQIALDHMIDEEFGDDVIIAGDCYDDNSILLVKPKNSQYSQYDGLENLGLDYLNLSPFVIDNNALKELDNVDMLFFECHKYDEKNSQYVYKRIEDVSNEVLITLGNIKPPYKKRRVEPVLDVFKKFVDSFKDNSDGYNATQPV